MRNAAARDRLPIALTPDVCALELGHACAVGIEVLRLRSGAGPASGTMSGWTTHCSSIHPTGEADARRYLDAVLLASSLPNNVAKTCFAFPTCGTALA